MDQIRDFYLTHFKERFPGLSLAFFWKIHPQRHHLGGDSRVMNWTSLTIGSYSLGQAGWVFLIYGFDYLHWFNGMLSRSQETGIKFGISAILFLIAFFGYPILYHANGKPTELENQPKA